jgi:hypothetical protein
MLPGLDADPDLSSQLTSLTQVDYQQHSLLTAAGVNPPLLPAFLQDQLLPAIASRLTAQPPPPDGAASQLAQLHIAAVRSLSEAFRAMAPAGFSVRQAAPGGGGVTPLSAHQLQELKQVQLVVDNGRGAPAAAFMVLGASAEGLRPIVAGPGFPLRPLPINYAVRQWPDVCTRMAVRRCCRLLLCLALMWPARTCFAVCISDLQLHHTT